MPPPEKADRFEALKRAYPAFVFDEMVEPSDSLVDKFHTMKERGVLKYLTWQEYGRRDAELENGKQEVVFKPDKQGVLRSALDSAQPIDTDVSSTFKLEKALYRRGAAMHMAALLSFDQHEKLIKYYFKEHLADPLPGYGRISLEQIARTDKEIFRRMAEETRAGLSLTPSGGYPLDDVIERVRVEPRIVVLMMPLPAARVPAAVEPNPAKRNSDAAEINRLREEVKRLKSSASSGPRPVQQMHKSAAPMSTGGKKDKGGGKKQRLNIRLPAELVGVSGLQPVWEGKKICFDFNMAKGCQAENSVHGCPRGHHICMRCGGNHPQRYQACPKR